MSDHGSYAFTSFDASKWNTSTTNVLEGIQLQTRLSL